MERNEHTLFLDAIVLMGRLVQEYKAGRATIPEELERTMELWQKFAAELNPRRRRPPQSEHTTPA